MKVTILRNFVQNNGSLDQGISMVQNLLGNINFPISFISKETTKQLTALSLHSDVVSSGYMIDPQPILDSIDGSEDVACMVYDWTKVKPQPTNPVTSWIKKGNAVPMQIPEQWYGYPTSYPEVFAQFFLHELCHALYFLTGHSVQDDKTHFQYQNIAYSQKQPTEYYLYLIKSLMPEYIKNIPAQTPINIPTITITRNSSDSKQTLGKLRSGDGQFGCDTLERPWLDNKQNISCIPKGIYNCQWKFKLNSLSYHYQVMNVPYRSGIFLHAGNFFFNSAGCILLGSQPQDINNDKELDLLNTKQILASFEKFMNKKPFVLVIQ